MTDLEYFKSCFIADCEIGCDDMDLAYSYLHCEDQIKWIRGFREFIKNNQILVVEDGADLEMVYSVEDFLLWVNKEMDAEDKAILESNSWEDYRVTRFVTLEEEPQKGRVIPVA